MKDQNNLSMKGYSFLLICGFACFPAAFAEEIEFNTDVLDLQDRENFDLTPFTQSGYIMPGEYLLDVKINGYSASTQKIVYRNIEGSSLPEAKLTKELMELMALKPAYFNALSWSEDGGVIYSSLPGMTAKADLGSSVLNISVPQIYLEYISSDWDPRAGMRALPVACWTTTSMPTPTAIKVRARITASPAAARSAAI